jgi:phosphinothricin acetyltransferase
MSDLTIRAMTAADWPAVEAIYVEGIATQNSTFEQGAPTWEQWDRAHMGECRFVAERAGQVVGWVALTRASPRHVYRGVAEFSVYVAQAARRSGVGRALMAHLIAESERLGIWTLHASIFLENTGSLALCDQMGFRRVGHFERIGKMHGRWRDSVLLERRSPVVE